jgi:hypothetical protein
MTSEADGYVFVKGCDSCPLANVYFCAHPSAPNEDGELVINTFKGEAHPDCPLRRHSLHIALEPTA